MIGADSTALVTRSAEEGLLPSPLFTEQPGAEIIRQQC
ncbi:hypothetical protein KIS4809_1826 [Bacillus sp. ZZV12-4809]|nr:hypothetical protein KIS4809_1826 [Bacillus sp. ZZV12-4809]